jgi:hypothetical protein
MARRTSRGGPGRPTSLTSDLAQVIAASIADGATFDAAMAAAGVHPSTGYRWLSEGSSDTGGKQFREFREAVTRARAKAELAMTAAVVQDARGGAVVKHVTRVWRNGTKEEEKQYAPPNGRVALEWLARMEPSRWARKTGIEVSGPGGAPVQVEHREVLIGQLADRLHATLAGPGGALALPAADD